jgi:acetyl esterase/lipase
MRWTTCNAVLVLLAMNTIGTIGRSEDVIVHENITYGKGGETELKLDLARPVEAGPFPAIVFIHGGGFYQGSRQAYQETIREAAKRGYVAATISYRLMQFDAEQKERTTAEPNFPAQIHDAKAAIRWLRANADQYDVDPDRIGVTGASAGGHLSLLIGLSDAGADLEGDGGNPERSSRVQAVVNFFGPTDAATCYEVSSDPWIFRLFLSGTPQERLETYRIASPATYTSSDDPPVLTLHGDQDTLVPVSQAKLLDDKMKKAGADHTLVVLKGQGHGFGGEHQAKAMKAMWNFFDQHLMR